MSDDELLKRLEARVPPDIDGSWLINPDGLTAAARIRELEERLEWRPISTMPRDGTRVLAVVESDCDGVTFDPIVTAWVEGWKDEGHAGPWQIVEGDLYWAENDWKPTSWMPLPEPPGEGR